MWHDIRKSQNHLFGEAEEGVKLMALAHKPTLTKPPGSRTIAVSGDVYLAVGEDTDGKYALWEAVVLRAADHPDTSTARARR